MIISFLEMHALLHYMLSGRPCMVLACDDDVSVLFGRRGTDGTYV